MSTRPDLLSHAGRCPEPLIAEAERRVGHTFPPSYRLVLGELGTVAFGAQEIYGLIHHDLDAVGVPNALWLYLSNVNEFAQPRRYFEFYNYGDGTTVALDLERCSASGECALVATHAGAWNEQTEEVPGDFGTFLLDLVRRCLAAEHPTPPAGT